MNLTHYSPVSTGRVLFRFLFRDDCSTYLFLKRIKSGKYIIKVSLFSVNYFCCCFLVTKVIQSHDFKKVSNDILEYQIKFKTPYTPNFSVWLLQGYFSFLLYSSRNVWVFMNMCISVMIWVFLLYSLLFFIGICSSLPCIWTAA